MKSPVKSIFHTTSLLAVALFCLGSCAPSGQELSDAIEQADDTVVESLLSRGADVNFQGEYGKTPLHVAAKCNNAEAVKLLLECGAEVNAKDDQGWTPLHSAAWNGSVEAATALLEGGADVNAYDLDDRTPLYQAEIAHREKMVELLQGKGGRR